MTPENDELMFHKFNCDCCKKEVTAHSFQEIIDKNKLCADCATLDITGGLKEKPKKYVRKTPHNEYSKKLPELNSLRRDKKKKRIARNKRPPTYEEREAARLKEDEKWNRIRAGYDTIEYPFNHCSSSAQHYDNIE